jgi:cytochrome c-type biogenesis protein CcmE
LRTRVRYWAPMDPSRKRRVRFVAALTAAVLLATALAYTSFAGASSSMEPSELARVAKPGETYQLTGKVEAGSWTHEGVVHRFRVEDRTGGNGVDVTYEGAVPDPFREGREIIVDVQQDGAGFVGLKDTLVTKCPSKFEAAEQGT